MTSNKVVFLLSFVVLLVTTTFSQLQSAVWSPPIALNFIPPTNSINGQQSLSGNTIITWYDTTTNNYLTSIYLVGSGSWTSPQVLVSSSLIAVPPSVAVNSSGYAVATWIQNGPGPTQSIETANFIGNSWVSLGTVASTPGLLNFTQTAIDVDPSGNILVNYTRDNGDTTNSLFSSIHTEAGWSAPQNLFTSGLNTDIFQALQTFLSSNGDGVIVWAATDGVNLAIYSINYTKATITYGPIITLFSAPASLTNLFASNSSSGNAIVTWVVNNIDVYVSTFIPVTGWSPAIILSSDPNTSNAYTSINNSGNAIVSHDANNTTISVSSLVNGTWSTQTVVTAGVGFAVGSSVIAMDAYGNGILIWTSIDTINNSMTFDYSTRNGLLGSWSSPLTIPFTQHPGTFEMPVRLVFIPADKAYFAFIVFSPPFFSDIEIIVGSFLFPPQPPSNFKGQIIKNQFLTETDIVHRLTWTASLSASVTSYQIYRNGVLIAKVSASGPLVYDDHNCSKKKVDTYTLVAVSGGISSTPVTIKL